MVKGSIVVGLSDIILGLWLSLWLLHFDGIEGWAVLGYGLSLVVCGAFALGRIGNLKALTKVFLARTLLYLVPVLAIVYGLLAEPLPEGEDRRETLVSGASFAAFFLVNGLVSLWLRRHFLKKVSAEPR